MSERLTPEQFVLNAIRTLRAPGLKGIHSVRSGFNDAFRKYSPGEDPVECTTRLGEAGVIVIRPARGGVVLYLPGEAPAGFQSGADALKRMGLSEGPP